MNSTIIGLATVLIVLYILNRAYGPTLRKLAAEAKAISQDPHREAPDAKEAFNKVIDEIKKEQNSDE